LIVQLSVATGIAMDQWKSAEDILTAIEILEKKNGI